MNCIVTGGAGFIGTHFLELLCRDLDVETIYVFDFFPPRLKHPKIVFQSIDIRNPIRVQLQNISLIYHLAALCKEPGYQWEEYFETNYIGTKNVCEYAVDNNIMSIVFTSTMMVFKAGEKRNSEEDITAPDTAYGISKLLAEEVLMNWKNSNPKHRLRIIRPGVVFGKGENGNYTRLVKALKKNLFVYVGKKSTIKGSIYVKEVVKFLFFVTNDTKDRIVYNFVFAEPDTIANICDSICELMRWKRFIPTIPFKSLLIVSYAFEFLDNIGIKNPVHHRRIEKLHYSTWLSSDAALAAGYRFSYTLKSALEDWKKDCDGQGLF
ncbi:MAG: NAD(P)-dependent oxidoreductase [Bacteroidota bacterium]